LAGYIRCQFFFLGPWAFSTTCEFFSARYKSVRKGWFWVRGRWKLRFHFSPLVEKSSPNWVHM